VFPRQISGSTKKRNAHHGDGWGDRQRRDEAQDQADDTFKNK